MSSRPNSLDFSTKEKAQYSLAILHSPTFRFGRGQTPEGQKLFNKELVRARRSARRFKIRILTPLPEKMKVVRVARLARVRRSGR